MAAKKEIKKFRRSKSDKMIAGVCGGLGEYFEVDSAIMRIIFLILLFSGAGLITYLIIWITVPSEG